MKAIGVPAQYAPKLAQTLIKDFQLPSDVESFTLALQYASDATWDQTDSVYSPTNNNTYAVKSVFKNSDYTSMMSSFIVVDLRVNFALLPDIQDTETYKSVAGGIFEHQYHTIQRIPHDLTLDDMTKMMNYFQLIQSQAVQSALFNPLTPKPSPL